MRQIQTAALELFEKHGFDAVTVEDIAAAAEVSPPTVYRQFGTKEQLVLWDEYDPQIYAAIRQRLAVEPPLAAVRHGLIEVFDIIYADDAARIRQRSRLTLSTAGLRAASAAGMTRMRRDLANMLMESPFIGSRFNAEILAATLTSVFEVTAEEWLRTPGPSSLRAIFDEVFERLPQLISLE